MYSLGQLYALRRSTDRKPGTEILSILSSLGLLRYRGRRAGRCVQREIMKVHNNKQSADRRDRMRQSNKDHKMQLRTSSENLIKIELSERKISSIDDQLNIACQNFRSIANKSAAVCDFLASSTTDILVATETWHEPGDLALLKSITPEGYKCIDCPRPIPSTVNTSRVNVTNHGGIAVIYKDTISIQRLTLPVDVSTFEYVCCRVCYRNKILILVSVYRPGSKPPTKQFFTDLTSLCDVLALHRCSLTLTGDFNIRVDRSNDVHAMSLADLLASYDLFQHVTTPTHEQGGILDLVITRSDDEISTINVENKLISDHSNQSLVRHLCQLDRTRTLILNCSIKILQTVIWLHQLILLII